MVRQKGESGYGRYVEDVLSTNIVDGRNLFPIIVQYDYLHLNSYMEDLLTPHGAGIDWNIESMLVLTLFRRWRNMCLKSRSILIKQDMEKITIPILIECI